MAYSMINFQLIKTALPHLAHGALISLLIAACSLCIGFGLGTVIALIQMARNSFLNTCAYVYVTIMRGTPMLIHIVFLYYVFSLTGINISALVVAIIAIGLNSGAYVSEIIRAGINSVSKGQIEAAKTLGIKRRDVIRYIILPQAVRSVLPALGNESITLIKDSSLASLIGVMELYKEGQIIMSQTYDALSVYCALALVYLCMTTSLSACINLIEKRLQHHA